MHHSQDLGPGSNRGGRATASCYRHIPGQSGCGRAVGAATSPTSTRGNSRSRESPRACGARVTRAFRHYAYQVSSLTVTYSRLPDLAGLALLRRTACRRRPFSGAGAPGTGGPSDRCRRGAPATGAARVCGRRFLAHHQFHSTGWISARTVRASHVVQVGHQGQLLR